MATKDLSILFVASEVEGLIKSGGLADVAKALPQALSALGHDVKVALPGYRKIQGLGDAPVLLDTKLEHWPHTAYKVRSMSVGDVAVFAIECDQYFARDEMYSQYNQAYPDNGERFSFFSAACLDMLPKLAFQPDIIHANDWHTGFVPYLLKHRYSEYPYFAHTKSVISIHNAVFKGVFSYDELPTLPEMQGRYAPDAAVSVSHVTMLKAGVMTADKINAVSPTYALELKTELGSHGMAKEFRARSHDLVGILNGCDYSDWNPATDEYIPVKYQAELDSMLAGKSAAKTALQQRVGLPQTEAAVYGMVCRLTNQKGLHYLLPILQRFLQLDAQLVIVGTGDPILATQLSELAARNSNKFAFVEAYSNELAHLVEAGSDFFLMPSEFEPCGLNQIYSMAYGTLPIVRAVGGLKDTVIDYDSNPDSATGFSFIEPEPIELLSVMQRSLLFYLQNRQEMHQMQLHAMKQQFCWKRAAQEYIELYRSAFH